MAEISTHVVIETQRYDVRGNAWLPVTDGKGWTDAQGNVTFDTVRFPLPEGHIWFDDWTPITSATQTDIDGWAYSPQLTGPWTAQNWSNSLYRRRSWCRKSARHAYTYHTFENERWFVVKGFSGARLPSDRAHWSDETGKVERRREAIDASLPSGYRWENEWTPVVNHPSETDAEGWTYAADFPSKYFPAKFASAFVRRRRWERKAVKVSNGSMADAAHGLTPLVITRQQLFESHELERATSEMMEAAAGGKVSGGDTPAPGTAAPTAAAATTATTAPSQGVVGSSPSAPTRPPQTRSEFQFADEPSSNGGSSCGRAIDPTTSRVSATVSVSSAIPTTTTGGDDFDALFHSFTKNSGAAAMAVPFAPSSSSAATAAIKIVSEDPTMF